MPTPSFPAYSDASYLGLETHAFNGGKEEPPTLLYPTGMMPGAIGKLSAQPNVMGAGPFVEFATTETEGKVLCGSTRRLLERKDCVFCGSPLIEKLMMASSADDAQERKRDRHLPDPTMIESRRFEERIWECQGCGWWKHIYDLNSAFSRPPSGIANFPAKFRRSTRQIAVYGTLKTFDLTNSDLPLLEVRRWLARHPKDATHLDPFLLERLLADCFRDTGTYSEVKLVGGRHDRGIDLILFEGQEQILVQVKRRASDRTVEQVSAVRELNGVLLREGVPRGMVITTAGRFSAGAHREVQLNRASFEGTFKRYNVDLMAMDRLGSLFTRRDKVSDPWDRHQDILDTAHPWVPQMRAKHVGPYG